MEIWLEPSLDGVILHYFLHAEPTGVAAWQLAKMNLAKITIGAGWRARRCPSR